MPVFSRISQSKLNTCHPDLITLFSEVVKEFDCTVLCGWRGEEEQNEAFRTGNSTKKWPDSTHNHFERTGNKLTPLSLGVDVAPYPVNWKDEKRIYLFAGYVKATAARLLAEGKMKLRLRLGADWNSDTMVSNERFPDPTHFEVIDAPLSV